MHDALEKLGFLDGHSLERAWAAHERTATPFHVALTELGLLSQEKLMEFWSAWLEIDVLEEGETGDAELIQLLTPQFLKNIKAVPLCQDETGIRIATANPINHTAFQTVSYLVNADVIPVCAAPRRIEALLDAALESDEGTLAAGGQIEASAYFSSDAAQLTALANEGPVVQQVNAMFTEAFERRVSDIHLEPQGTGLNARFRVDGQLIDARYFDASMSTAIISRLKILGGMDITERRMPQDGRSSIVTGGQKIDLRLSTLPTVDGESIVIRLLVQDASKLTWDALGFDLQTQAQLDEIIRRPVGMFLVTGPTGSGKTTTLYTALGKLDRKEKKIISVEDPVEYRLRGIMQVQVHQELGLDFANVLRTTMRHNPNTIMIGEIRDTETAQMALRAAMTGHQVFSTLHTDGAISSINRLADMGVPRYLLGAHINAIMSQRLVRKLCQNCSEPAPSTYSPHGREGELKQWGDIAHRIAKGCRDCNGSGYRGRTLVSELLVLSRNIRQLISDGKSWHEIREATREEGFQTQFEHGLQLVSEGITSVDEILSNVEPA
ncbi:MAG: GspE/PulE family protein [Pseudomonadota bacterium]